MLLMPKTLLVTGSSGSIGGTDNAVGELGHYFTMPCYCLRAFFITLALFLLFSSGTRATEPTVILKGSFSPTNRLIDPVNYASLSKEMPLWDSAQGDHRLTGSLSYGPFVSGDFLELMVVGFPGIPGVSLTLVSTDNGERLALRPTSHPGWRWTRFHWKLPPDWANHNCVLIADDSEKVNGGGWVGVSAPLPHTGRFGRAIEETGLQIAVFVLLFLPGLATVLFFPQFKPTYALAFLLTSSALAAYTVFFLYFWHPLIGKTASWTIYAFCATALVIHWKQALARLQQFDFSAPLVLGTAAASLYFSAGFLYGGIESPEGLAMSRFLPGMPPDPLLPHWVAKILAQGEPLRPFFADWLTSDRPPLQAGLNLLIWPFIPVRYGYQVVGIAAQCWVWIGLWAFLRHLGVSLRGTALVMAGAIFSGFYLVNSVFCWPKHLPAAFLLLATGLIWGQPKDKILGPLTTVLIAACMAFALLGHGGSVFGVGGIVIVYLLERRALSLRFIITGALTGLILMSPWTLYQKLADPPGDRLIKYHLAGREPIDPRPSLTVIREAYSELTWRQILDNKCTNFRTTLCGSDWSFLSGASDYINQLRSGTANRDSYYRLLYSLRSSEFTYYIQALGPLVFGFIGLLLTIRSKQPNADKDVAYLAIKLGLFSVIVWCLLMFKGNSTAIYLSSYFTGACLYVSVGLGLLFMPKTISISILLASIGWFFWLWMTPPVFNETDQLAPSAFAGFGSLVIASSLAISYVLLCALRSKPSSVKLNQP